ncbi:Rer1-like protein [Elsinoe fawcettii]|nr:Rer1-like protein [Elsinoe fawcettii]
MDAPEPDTPFAAVTAQTSKYGRVGLPYPRAIQQTTGQLERLLNHHSIRTLTQSAQIYQSYLDKSTPFATYRWIGTGVVFILFALRIIFAQGWYIVAYSLGIYLLNLFLAFISPKFDPGLETDEDMEEGSSSLPTKSNEEFKPFVRRLPEFKFWYSATRAIVIAFFCSWSEYFNLPVFWPVLVIYWLILVVLTMRRQIQHMLKYRYVPWDYGKQQFKGNK